LRQDVEDQHVEAAGALVVSTGLHGLRPDPYDARALVTTTDAGVYPTARPAAVVLSDFGPRVMTQCIYEGSRECWPIISNGICASAWRRCCSMIPTRKRLKRSVGAWWRRRSVRRQRSGSRRPA